MLLAQHTLFDPTRAPEGKHTAWAYCHVPNGWRGDLTDAIEAQVERFAPGFRELVLARAVTTPADFEAGTATSSAGTSTAARWTSGSCWRARRSSVNPYRTPLAGVYLCSCLDAARRRRPWDVRLLGGADGAQGMS